MYATYGGYSMERSIKQALEKRGYDVYVGKLRTLHKKNVDDIGFSLHSSELPADIRYVVHTEERREKFNPFWCPLNGFWWWNFNVSIADQKTGIEIMTWRGRGCANSSIRKLNAILDELEK